MAITNFRGAIGFFYLIISLTTYGQLSYQPYKWEDKRSLYPVPEEQAGIPLYVIHQTVQYQYAYDEPSRDFVCYKTLHKIIRVNNDEALSSNNRIYIPMYNTIGVMAVKARSITPDGREIILDENNIKELQDEKSGYRIFAIEGAEVGGEIEYYFTQKMHGSSFGVELFQYDYPVNRFDFRISTPENLEYDFNVVNDPGAVSQVDTTDQGNVYTFTAVDIPALYNEDFSSYDASRKRIDFKLAYNSVAGKGRLFTWGDAGKRIYDQVCLREKEEEKQLKKFMKSLNLSGGNSWDNFLKAEHYLKSNLMLEKEAGGDASKIDFVLKNRYGSPLGFTRIYAALASQLGLDYEIVVSCDRFSKNFDPDFDSWSYLDDFLIYFPDQDLFLSPESTSFRVGTIPADYLTNYALFIHPERIQDFIYPISRIDQIPAPGFEENFDNLDIVVNFMSDLGGNQVTVSRSYKGYMAEYYKAALPILEEEQKKQMLNEIVKYLAPDAEIESLETLQADLDYKDWKQPFIVKSDFTTKGYIQLAGNTLLFKAGELIGPQSEMYQESERKMDIVNDYNRGYLRKITINIPEGYTIQNPDDLTLKEQVFEGERLIFNFDSNYELKGDQLDITIEEWYDQIHYPKEKFEDFRRVINAAADWNKVVLVMKKN